jgi:hypothetical protein
MKKTSIVLIILAAIVAITSISQSAFNSAQPVTQSVTEVIEFDSTGYLLLQEKCMSCHSSTVTNHDDRLAPPMFAIKKRYLKTYTNRDDFIEGITTWATNPKEDKAMMHGAVNKFKVMPNMNFAKEDLVNIAGFIYDNEMEKPACCEQGSCKKDQQGKKGKMRNGQGKQHQGKNKKCCGS